MSDSTSRRVAWITGAGKGIGRALAKHLAGDGWTVAVSARTESDLESLRDDCPDGSIRIFPLDVTQQKETEATIERIETEVGPLELAVLNAGTHAAMTADSFTVEAVGGLMNVNLMGTVNGLAPLISRFRSRQRGHIAVVASLAGYRGLPGAAAYSASKAALIAMCESLRPELERSHIRLSLINPGFVETPLTGRNDFPMPFLIPADRAARAIARGLARKRFEITFPWPLVILMKLLRLLPYGLFFSITRRMVRS